MDFGLDFDPSIFAPTFRQRSGSDRFCDAIAADRAILADDARAWAKTPAEAILLAEGLARARQTIYVAHLPDQNLPYPTLFAAAYPVEALLALAGKASAKKAILELASREHADSPWFGVACARICSSAFRYARLLPCGFEDRGSEAQRMSAYLAEEVLSHLGETERSPAVGGARAIASRCHCLPDQIPLVAWALGQALGAPALDLTAWSSTRPTEEIALQAATWNATRLEAALIGAQTLAPAAGPSKARL